MTEEIQNAIKNFEIYKENVREHTKKLTFEVSRRCGEISYTDLLYANFSDPTGDISYFLDLIERVDRVIEFLKSNEESTKKELKMCSCAKGFKMKIENDKLLCTYCGKEIEEMIKQ